MSSRHYGAQKAERQRQQTAALPRLLEIRKQLEAINPGRAAVIAGVAVERCTRVSATGEHIEGWRVGGGEAVSLFVAADQLAARESQR